MISTNTPLPMSLSLRRPWIAAVLCIALLSSACGKVEPMTATEVAREISPDGRVDLVLTEHNPGATASFVYRVHLVAHGDAPSDTAAVAELYGATRSHSAYGADLRWEDDRTAVVEYLQAKSTDIMQASTDIEGRRVTLLLRGGVENDQAPAGGMAPR